MRYIARKSNPSGQIINDYIVYTYYYIIYKVMKLKVVESGEGEIGATFGRKIGEQP